LIIDEFLILKKKYNVIRKTKIIKNINQNDELKTLNNQILEDFINKKSFWIYKKLKSKGFIAGKYEICHNEKNNSDLVIRETILPKVVKELVSKELFFEAIYDDKEDLKELLELSNKNLLNSNVNSWQKVLPLYPISPIN